jgi:hypothetical protein
VPKEKKKHTSGRTHARDNFCGLTCILIIL